MLTSGIFACITNRLNLPLS